MDFTKLIDQIIKSQIDYRNVLENNESQTRWMLIDPFLLDGLGFEREDIILEYSIDKTERKSKYNKLDYVVMANNKPRILVEAKSLGINVYDNKDQLKEYYNEISKLYDYKDNELIGILTNGDSYIFYTNAKDSKEIDDLPFFSIQLSTADTKDILQLANYRKNSLVNEVFELASSIEEFELFSYYRIDLIENAFNYFSSKGVSVGIHAINLKGRFVRRLSFAGLYKKILKEINAYKPNLLFDLAKDEDIKRNGKIAASKFSLSKINSSNIEVETSSGVVYVSIPSTKNGIIDRILYLVRLSNFGEHNILISLKKLAK